MFEFDDPGIERAAAAEVAALRAAGAQAGDSIGWLALNEPRALALLRACAQLGLRFVPLNWRLAAPELAAIARHAGLQILWHDEAMRPLADRVRALVTLPQAPAPGHRQGDLMLVYTSGTTGEPKGAIHTAAAMHANIAAAIDAQGFDASTRTLAVLPLFHVGGLCIQVLPTMAAGGVVRLHARFDAGAWLRDVAAWRPSTSLLVPATMRALIEHPDWPAADLSSLAFVNTGSSIVPRALIDAFHARGVPVCQVYGATETGPVTLVLRPDEAMVHPGKAGRPALGVEVALVEGEVWVRGANLARGYHREPDAPAFAEGWFRTGDLALRGDDGLYEIVGRCKDLIISGGENIYPAEIENLALGDPAVADAAVVGVPDAHWGEVPVLVVVPRAGARIDTDRLRALFAERLARFKHPRRIVVRDALPKTALGKVQRTTLANGLAGGSAVIDVARRRLLQALGAAVGALHARTIEAAAMPLPGIGLAADFDPVSAVWLSHAVGHEPMTRGLVEALRPHVALRFLVTDDAAARHVRTWFPSGLDVTIEPQATFFVRDVAVFTREPEGSLGIVDFRASQYGAAVWCQRRYGAAEDAQGCIAHAREQAAERDGLDRAMALQLAARLHRTPLALEGGAVEVNGRGLMIANEELHRSRNPELSRAEVEHELLRLPGVRKVLWLPWGLAEDVLLRATITGPYVAWGAGGHTDEFVRFADERTVLLAWPDDADAAAHPVSHKTRLRMQKNLRVLLASTDTHGRRLRVIKVPMPRIVQRRVVLSETAGPGLSEEWSVDYFAPHERRRAGDELWQVATASYLNFVVANGVVVLPDFVPHGTPPERQDRVRRLLSEVFGGRRIEFVDGISAHWVGGGLHCATLNEP